MRLGTAIARYAMSVSSVAPGARLFFATAPASAEGPELRHSIKIGVLNDRSGAHAGTATPGVFLALSMREWFVDRRASRHGCDGEMHEIHGSAIAVHPWCDYHSSHVAFHTLRQWQSGDRVGFSEMADIFGLEYLAEHGNAARV